jgi:hypothetical protein
MELSEQEYDSMLSSPAFRFHVRKKDVVLFLNSKHEKKAVSQEPKTANPA